MNPAHGLPALRYRAILLAFSLVVAAGCVSLGFWQLGRLGQRRERNALALAHLRADAVQLPALANSGDSLRFRRVIAEGTFDYSREFALGGRSRNGSPGVHLFTPLVRATSDTVTLVLRGWVYSPDAATVRFERWREPADVSLAGYTLLLDPPAPGPDSSLRAPRTVHRLDRDRLATRLGAPIAPFYIVMTEGGAADGDSVPVRLGEPLLDEGPHLSYAVQWFLFAAIFGAGGTVVVLQGRPRTSQGENA